MTFSIVAYAPEEEAWGVAVASKFPAVGAVVPWAVAGAGAVATQSYAKLPFGPDGLALMRRGLSAKAALDQLLSADDDPAKRQVALVDAGGGVAAFTGVECHDWCGHLTFDNFSVQGNLLAGESVPEAMARAFRAADGELADRLVTALRAGESAGGDRRGKQSAAVLVARENAGYGNDNDRYLDLRVDDSPEPVAALADLVTMHHLYFQPPDPSDTVPLDAAVIRELQTMLIAGGYMTGGVNGEWDESCAQAFWMLIGNENLEMRWSPKQGMAAIDRMALEHLRKRFG